MWFFLVEKHELEFHPITFPIHEILLVQLHKLVDVFYSRKLLWERHSSKVQTTKFDWKLNMLVYNCLSTRNLIALRDMIHFITKVLVWFREIVYFSTDTVITNMFFSSVFEQWRLSHYYSSLFNLSQIFCVLRFSFFFSIYKSK